MRRKDVVRLLFVGSGGSTAVHLQHVDESNLSLGIQLELRMGV